MYGMYKPLRMLVRQKLVDALGRMIWRPSEDGLRIDIVELGGRDERVDSSRPAATFVRAGDNKGLAVQRFWAVPVAPILNASLAVPKKPPPMAAKKIGAMT
jgi:hypothetical protein